MKKDFDCPVAGTTVAEDKEKAFICRREVYVLKFKWRGKYSKIN